MVTPKRFPCMQKTSGALHEPGVPLAWGVFTPVLVRDEEAVVEAKLERDSSVIEL